MKPQQPIIKHDPDLGWELFVPQHLLPTQLRTITVSPVGLYIETVTDTWDQIPFEDLADLVADDGRTLDERMDLAVANRNLSIIAHLTCPVDVKAGQPEEILSGQERAYRRWTADQRHDDGGLWQSDYVERM